VPIPRAAGRWNKGRAEPGHQAYRSLGARLRCHRPPGPTLWPPLPDPVNVFPAEDGYIFALTYGTTGTDWVRNVLAAGSCELRTRGRTIQPVSPRLFHAIRWFERAVAGVELKP
jgi:hypothetical protein